MIFPRSSMDSPVTMGASGKATSFAAGGGLCGTARAGAVATAAEMAETAGAEAATGRDTGAAVASDVSIRRRIPRSNPANLDLTMLDINLVSF